MNTRSFTPVLMSAFFVSLTAAVGCEQVNRVYKQDTGELAPVPGPPTASVAVDPAPAESADRGVEFVEPLPAGEVLTPLPDDAVLAPAAAPRTYEVQSGDSYWKIAKKIYNDPSRAKDIAAANPGLDPKKLRIGDEIVLPE
ncbi:MAG: LysM peptidoglycan-binding domain-containing protein [Planctomycetota bacterium]